MRVLAVTNMYPTPRNPALGTFVGEQIEGLRNIGLEVDILFADRQRKGIGAYVLLPTRLRARLKTFDADVVHVMYGGVMADIVTRLVRDRPTVVSFHGSDLLGEELAGRARRIISSYGVWSSWMSARRATGLVVVGKRLQDALPDDIDRSKVRIIPCGINTTHFRPLDQTVCREQVNWRGDDLHVLFNSNGDDPVKRPVLARAAVESLNRLGIPAQMRELRRVPHAEVPLWLNASDVLLLTSRHEGSPTIVKEALACNVPVVSVDVGDVGERIQGIEGCYIASADPDDLAATLQLVHARCRRRVNARLKIEELSSERMAWRLRAFYEELSSSSQRHNRSMQDQVTPRPGNVERLIRRFWKGRSS
jgi:teichuronic acid biosynthesis glycosyltransferase TuaC